MNRLLCAFVILVVLFVSMSSFAEEPPSQTSSGQTTETQAPASGSPGKEQEYKFEASEIEKKPYHVGGYLEFRPILYGLDKESCSLQAEVCQPKRGEHQLRTTTGGSGLKGAMRKGSWDSS